MFGGRIMRGLAVTFLAMMVAGQALAFEPNPGTRAYPIAGRDLVSGETISLEDYRGKWVLLEFWASW